MLTSEDTFCTFYFPVSRELLIGFVLCGMLCCVIAVKWPTNGAKCRRDDIEFVGKIPTMTL